MAKINPETINFNNVQTVKPYYIIYQRLTDSISNFLTVIESKDVAQDFVEKNPGTYLVERLITKSEVYYNENN